MRKIIPVLLIWSLAWSLASGQIIIIGKKPSVGTAFITNAGNGSDRSNHTGCLGFQFTVNATTTVAELGYYVRSGNTESHVVRMVNVDTGAQLGNVTIATSGEPTGYKYATLGSPIVLSSSVNYAILTSQTSGNDVYFDDDGTYTETADGTIVTSVYTVGACTADPLSVSTSSLNTTYVPPNFRYTL